MKMDSTLIRKTMVAVGIFVAAWSTFMLVVTMGFMFVIRNVAPTKESSVDGRGALSTKPLSTSMTNKKGSRLK